MFYFSCSIRQSRHTGSGSRKQTTRVCFLSQCLWAWSLLKLLKDGLGSGKTVLKVHCFQDDPQELGVSDHTVREGATDLTSIFILRQYKWLSHYFSRPWVLMHQRGWEESDTDYLQCQTRPIKHQKKEQSTIFYNRSLLGFSKLLCRWILSIVTSFAWK